MTDRTFGNMINPMSVTHGGKMPLKSKAQMRYMFAKHPKIASKWAKITPDMKNLPEEVGEKPDMEKSEPKSMHMKNPKMGAVSKWAYLKGAK